MRSLFVNLKHIGDPLLLHPTLMAVHNANEGAEIWVVVRRGCERILAGCSAISPLLTTVSADVALRSSIAWVINLCLCIQLRWQEFDHAFEFGSGAGGRWLGSMRVARTLTAEVAGGPPHWWWRWQFNSLEQVQAACGRMAA